MAKDTTKHITMLDDLVPLLEVRDRWHELAKKKVLARWEACLADKRCSGDELVAAKARFDAESIQIWEASEIHDAKFQNLMRKHKYDDLPAEIESFIDAMAECAND
jgi:hypothetical protein